MIGDVASFKTYADARGYTYAPASDADIGLALERASDYITFHYVDRFQTGYDETSARVDSATYEATVLELATPGFFAKTYTPGERKVLTQVEGIRWEVVGGQSSSMAAPVSTRIEAMLRQYLTFWPSVTVV